MLHALADGEANPRSGQYIERSTMMPTSEVTAVDTAVFLSRGSTPSTSIV
jgi:hypothetical protein